MALVPLTLQPFEDRIKAACPGFQFVERAANVQTAIDSRQVPMPAAFLLEPTVNKHDDPVNASSLITQELFYEVGVLTMVQNYAGERGKLQSQDAEALRAQLWAALIGWQPVEGGRSVEYGSGALVAFDDQVFFYLDTFGLRYRIRG